MGPKLWVFEFKRTTKNKYGSLFYNFTDREITIDSIQHKFIGNNFSDFIITDSSFKMEKLPFVLKNFSAFGFYIPTSTHLPEVSQCPIKIFGHYNDNSESFTIMDTAVNKYGIIHDFQLLYSPSDISNWQYKDDSTFIGGNHVKINTNEKWTLNNIDYDIPNSTFLKVNTLDNIPVTLDSISYVFLVRYFKYISHSLGDNLIRIRMNFESERGEKFTYRYIYHINVIEKNDIPGEIQIDSKFDIYPNPFSDILNINQKTQSELFNNYEIYNLSGNLITSGNFINNFKWNPDMKVLPGEYILKIISNKEIIMNKLIYIK